MPKIELEIDNVEVVIEALKGAAGKLQKKIDNTENVDDCFVYLTELNALRDLRQKLRKWQQKNEWYEFETPLGKFAVNRAGDVKVDENLMAPGCNTIVMDVPTLVAKAFPNG